MTTALDLIYEALKDRWFASKATKYYYDSGHDPEKIKIYQRVEMDYERNLKWIYIAIKRGSKVADVSCSEEDFTSCETADQLREIKDDRMIRKLTAIEAKHELELDEEEEEDDDYF
jgi:hypothetical protein